MICFQGCIGRNLEFIEKILKKENFGSNLKIVPVCSTWYLQLFWYPLATELWRVYCLSLSQYGQVKTQFATLMGRVVICFSGLQKTIVMLISTARRIYKRPFFVRNFINTNPLRGREDFFEKNLFGSPSDPESKNIVFIDTVQF